MVPYSQRSRLLATFNGGFTYVDGQNGSADNGQTNEPLKDGNATLIGYTDGRVDIVDWSGGPNPGSGVAWARQSLAPIVWNSQLNPALNTDPNSPQWGYTLGGVTRVWRTGVGIDARGNLIYVAADYQTVVSIAADPSARRSRAGHGVRHQPGMAFAQHLQSPRSQPDPGGAQPESVTRPLPRPRRP